MQRKRTTVQDYRIMLRRHLVPFFGQRPIDTIEAADIGDYIVRKRRSGLAMKTVTNHLQFAHGVFAFAMRRGWVRINAVAMADRPPSSHPIRTSASLTARNSRRCSELPRTTTSVHSTASSGSRRP